MIVRNDTNYLNYKKMYKNMLSNYNKIKPYIDLKPIKLNHISESKSKRKTKEKDDFLTINYDSYTKINTPTYNNSLFNSQGGDSKKKKNKSNNKNELKKKDISTPNYMIKLKRNFINSKNNFNSYIENGKRGKFVFNIKKDLRDKDYNQKLKKVQNILMKKQGVVFNLDNRKLNYNKKIRTDITPALVPFKDLKSKKFKPIYL
jgi:hypothetical protein